eukprot:762626-Hanusia_phi.AAC.2
MAVQERKPKLCSASFWQSVASKRWADKHAAMSREEKFIRIGRDSVSAAPKVSIEAGSEGRGSGEEREFVRESASCQETDGGGEESEKRSMSANEEQTEEEERRGEQEEDDEGQDQEGQHMDDDEELDRDQNTSVGCAKVDQSKKSAALTSDHSTGVQTVGKGQENPLKTFVQMLEEGISDEDV